MRQMMLATSRSLGDLDFKRSWSAAAADARVEVPTRVHYTLYFTCECDCELCMHMSVSMYNSHCTTHAHACMNVGTGSPACPHTHPARASPPTPSPAAAACLVPGSDRLCHQARRDDNGTGLLYYIILHYITLYYTVLYYTILHRLRLVGTPRAMMRCRCPSSC